MRLAAVTFRMSATPPTRWPRRVSACTGPCERGEAAGQRPGANWTQDLHDLRGHLGDPAGAQEAAALVSTAPMASRAVVKVRVSSRPSFRALGASVTAEMLNPRLSTPPMPLLPAAFRRV